jgi:hypothetical protein
MNILTLLIAKTGILMYNLSNPGTAKQLIQVSSL